MAKIDRNGQRKTRESFQIRRPMLGHYYIYTDTKETECNYIVGLKDSLPSELQGRIIIQVFKTRTDKLVADCKEKAGLEPQFSEPWIVFDRDKVKKFDEIIAEAKRSGIKVGWSNPCFEIWLDAYFGEMHSYFDSTSCCLRFSETFQKKTGQKYDKANKRIYEFVNRYGNEKAAISIAEQRLSNYYESGEQKPSKMCPCTTVHRLVQEIKEKVTNIDSKQES